MSIVDYQTKFSRDQDMSSFTTGNNTSTNYIDLGEEKVGNGKPIEMFVKIDEAVTSDGSATVQFQIETDDNSSFSSSTMLNMTRAIAVGSLTAGAKVLQTTLPRNIEQYVRMNYSVAVADLTDGQVTAGLILDDQNNTVYPS